MCYWKIMHRGGNPLMVMSLFAVTSAQTKSVVNYETEDCYSVMENTDTKLHLETCLWQMKGWILNLKLCFTFSLRLLFPSSMFRCLINPAHVDLVFPTQNRDSKFSKTCWCHEIDRCVWKIFINFTVVVSTTLQFNVKSEFPLLSLILEYNDWFHHL